MSKTARTQVSALGGSRRQKIFSNIIHIITIKKENKTQRRGGGAPPTIATTLPQPVKKKTVKLCPFRAQ